MVNLSEVCEAILLHTFVVIYSASPVLKATKFCSLLCEYFMVEQQPDVFFQSIVLSAQSKLAYLANSSLHWGHDLGHI